MNLEFSKIGNREDACDVVKFLLEFVSIPVSRFELIKFSNCNNVLRLFRR